MLATPDELGAWLQQDSIKVATATLLLSQATAAVQRAVRQRLVQVLADTCTLVGTPEAWLSLPQRPVTAVSSVLMDGTAVSSAEWTLNGDRLFRTGGWQQMTIPWWIAAATPFRYGLSYAWGAWDRPVSNISLTYDHGWATGAPELEPARTATLQLAATAYRNPAGVRSESIDDYQVSYLDATNGMTLPETHARELRRVYARIVGAIRTPV